MKAEISEILEELLAKFDVGKTYLHKTTLGKQQMLTATSSLTALIIKWLEENKRECHHTGSKVGVGDGEKGYLFNGQYCENCKGRNQLITELIGEVR